MYLYCMEGWRHPEGLHGSLLASKECDPQLTAEGASTIMIKHWKKELLKEIILCFVDERKCYL